MFPYREDNVQTPLNSFSHIVSAHNVTFNLKFNVNKIGFNSKLNEDFINKLKSSNFYEEWDEIFLRDYQVNKR